MQCDPTAAVPTPLGGTIRDGTYVMVQSTYYGDNSGAACPSEVDNTTWSICGSSWQTAQVSTVTGMPPYTLIGNITVVATGTALTLNVTCGITPPPTPPFTFTYDAAGNALRLHINGTATAGRIDTFQRQ